MFDEFKASLLYAKLPSRWAIEAAVAVLTLTFVLGVLALLHVQDRTMLFIAAIGLAWYGTRIVLVAVRRRSPKGPGPIG